VAGRAAAVGVVTDQFLPPWVSDCGVDPTDTDVLARYELAFAAAVREVGREDLVEFVPMGQSAIALADKRLAYRAALVAIGSVGLRVVPCLTCWLADIEDQCTGVAVVAALAVAECHADVLLELANGGER
jgi:hypothetical protein